ncbi:hypothetical protein PV08_02111 [Exophiala spinifera]|uniref:AAA+ ATPase domain-containing protein n=1 Tax=Exophiala spinifera TaxID=91928 RepID=A0A0D1Z1M1_9EURO|nr:uncharacterized protein PV08_02111 [Exophiala spinifera]KIW21531.1 hypothetical protein PV08_02111 [Exophiala spinifera]
MDIPLILLNIFFPGVSTSLKSIIAKSGLESLPHLQILIYCTVLFLVTSWAVGYLLQQVFKWFSASIVVHSQDDIYNALTAWLSEQRSLKRSLSLQAVTAGNLSENSNPPNVLDESAVSKTFRIATSATRNASIEFEPSAGIHWFLHGGRIFQLLREERQSASVIGGSVSTRVAETMKITTLGFSTSPIKELFFLALKRQHERELTQTVVFRSMQLYPGRSIWSRLGLRQARPMDTVYLDKGLKDNVIADIAEFLNPNAASWYANHGIPYRRGYLFYGPSGSGKTSFATALAGHFGLDIYTTSLMDASHTEDSLISLFMQLPRFCIVLLEDVDCAGITRPISEPAQEIDECGTLTTREHSALRTGTARSPISLSCLLNAIDGVSASEGRVLVLTTNYRERLDDALIRPGRVDYQVQFRLASRPQARELFWRIYSPHPSGSAQNISKFPLTVTSNDSKRISNLSDEFAALVPESRYGLADLQGFLLARKSSPEKAIADIKLRGIF